MTNDPLDPDEASFWSNGIQRDERFHAALRLDRLLNDPSEEQTEIEVRRLLDAWSKRL